MLAGRFSPPPHLPGWASLRRPLCRALLPRKRALPTPGPGAQVFVNLSRHFVSKSGHTQLSPKKVDQLGLGEERCPESRSQAEGPHRHMRKPGQPALLTAEEHLQRETTVAALAAFLWGKQGPVVPTLG